MSSSNSSSNSSRNTTTSSSFPLEDLVPRNETNALQFLQDHPTFDGRNVTIGILDTGVDPGARVLQTLPDGGPKLVDLVDCTGSGDVDVSTEVRVKRAFTTAQQQQQEEGEEKEGNSVECWEVEGLSGRKLKLPVRWNLCEFPKSSKNKSNNDNTNNTTKQQQQQKDDTTAPAAKQEKEDDANKTDPPPPPVRLGLKRAYELFPDKLKNRVKEERLKDMNEALAGYIAQVRHELAEWTSKYGEQNNSKSTIIAPEQLKIKEDLTARLQVLQDKEWQDDPGPMYDCVVFYDGTNYRAVIDVQETGDFLANATPMTDFRIERQYGTFGTTDQFNYAINVLEEGNILSIVCDAGAHGTHVAGIAAALEKERSGVAPGAQLIGFKIGDSRLGSMETGTALTRALIEAVKRKCDVINLSYGEGCVLPNQGRFVKLAEDLVWKHNILFVSSAGNNGPAISTVGAPGGTSSAILGVAAYVSPAMMKANYSMVESLNAQNNNEELVGTTYTWSSVGPTADGDNGVNVTAPGGAITSVPNWTLQKSTLMNGTSMSSPHAAGCVALLLSACKVEGIPMSPSRIYRALENTAKTLEGLSTLQQGCGMIQVDKAWEYLVAHRDDSFQDIRFDVSIENRSGNPRGIYLREAGESSVVQTFVIQVSPQFRKDDVDDETQRSRVDFEMLFQLKASESWVNAPEHFMLMHNGRTFKIEVDPTGLPPGVHTAKVLAFASSQADCGAMFSVPITVVKTLGEQRQFCLGEIDFKPAEVKRYFVNVPLGATWMDVTVRDCRCDDDSSARLVVMHTIQLLPHAAYRDAETQKYFYMLPQQTTVTSVRVHAGLTCEIDLARYWSAVGSTKIDVSFEFRGVRPLPDSVTLTSGNGGACIRLFSDLRNESIEPTAKLTKWQTPLRPKAEGIISPLGERDVIPSRKKQIYQLILVYEFNQEEAGPFTPRSPALQGVLYESAYESQMMLIFDGEKKYLGVADSWPSEVQAPKGQVVIRMQIRHDDPEMLEKLKDLAIWIERKLEKDIPLSVYASKEAMMVDKNSKLKKRTLRRGTCTSVFFAEPPSSKIPSSCKPGDILFGTAHYGSGDSSLPGDGKRPGGFHVSFLVGPKAASKKSEASTPEVPDERDAAERMAEAVRDLKVEQLSKLTAKEKEAGMFEQLYDTLEKEYPDHLPLLMAKLKHVDTKEKRQEAAAKVVDAADIVIGKISGDELALHFGKNHDKDDPSSCKEHKEMEKKKSFLVEALARKAKAYADLKTEDASTNFHATLDSLKKWIDIDSDKKYASLTLEREKRAGRLGSAIKLVNELLQSKGEDTKGGIFEMSQSDLLSMRAEIFEELGYTALVNHDKKWRLIASPKSYAPF